jgi:cell division septum initiation protein DivIVA
MRDETTLEEAEPELGAIDAYELAQDEPPFPLVIRGYDRRSVDEYLDASSARIAELEALQSPSLAVKEALERLADDTGGILKEAHETAEGVVTRARAEAEHTTQEARLEADRMIAAAEARARQLAIDTDHLWQERMRLIDDVHAVSASLAGLAETAAARFPAEEVVEEDLPVDSGVVVAEAVDEVVDEIVEQPTEAIDVAAIWAAEDAEVEDVQAEGEVDAEGELTPEDDGRPLPEGLDDLESPPEFR